MQGVDRSRRVGQQIRRELADILPGALEGEGLGMVSITRVNLSKDLRHARIFVTALAPKVSSGNVIQALNANAAALRFELGRRAHLRRTPDLIFEYDESIEYGAKMSRLLDSLHLDQIDSDDDENEK
ncbi:MAG: 30S ribosome-binding factor RbfA [Arenicellales bacterium]